MQKLKLSFIVFMTGVSALCVSAQDVESTAIITNGALKEYRRPSLTVLYINRGEEIAGKVIDKLIERGIPDKFNDNSIPNNVIRYQGRIPEAELDKLIETDITKEVVRRWFPTFDVQKGKYSSEVVLERGLEGATDLEKAISEGTILDEALLKNSGWDYIGRSFIVVYDLYDSKSVGQETSTLYETSCDVYLYQLDWSPEVYNSLMKEWKNPKAIDELKFPARKIASFVGASQLTSVIASNSKSDPSPLSEVFARLAGTLEQNADVYLVGANEDFKVKTSVFDTSPIRAKIGKKEGVKVDQRYFVYEVELDPQTNEPTTHRKGVVRATSAIVDNRGIATGDGGTSRFYQIHGGSIRKGMLMQQNPDWGIGISLLGGADVTVLAELNAGMWINATSGLKIYAKYAYPLSKMEVDGKKLIDNKTQKELTWETISVGVSKDLYFARMFCLTPYVGYTMLMTPEDFKEDIKKYDKATESVELGANLGIAILYNVQLVGNVGYNLVKASWYADGLTLGAGLRVQF